MSSVTLKSFYLGNQNPFDARSTCGTHTEYESIEGLERKQVAENLKTNKDKNTGLLTG